MRLIDADELIEHAWRDKLDSRELIADMINRAPTVVEVPVRVPVNIFNFNDETIKILDKIKTEIESEKIEGFAHRNGGLEIAMQIIDKYKQKSEE